MPCRSLIFSDELRDKGRWLRILRYDVFTVDKDKFSIE
jgi:hypothetical protein